MVSSHNITGMRMDTNSVFKSIDSTKLHHLALNAPGRGSSKSIENNISPYKINSPRFVTGGTNLIVINTHTSLQRLLKRPSFNMVVC